MFHNSLFCRNSTWNLIFNASAFVHPFKLAGSLAISYFSTRNLVKDGYFAPLYRLFDDVTLIVIRTSYIG